MDEWIQLASMTVIVMSLLVLLLMVVVVYILQDNYKTNIELVNQAQESGTAASEKVKAGSLTCTNSTATTTEMDTTYSGTTQRTSDGVIERLDSLNFYPPKTRIFSLSRFRRLVSSIK